MLFRVEGVWRGLFALGTGLALCPMPVAGAEPARAESRFVFGPAQAPPGQTRVAPDAVYSEEARYGFEGGAKIEAIDRGGADPARAGFCTSETPFFFSVAVPEGNYRVTVTLGDARGES